MQRRFAAVSALVFLLAAGSSLALEDTEDGRLAGALLERATAGVRVASLDEGFDNVAELVANGWFMQNNSSPLGSAGWLPGHPTLFNAHQGLDHAYIAAAVTSTTGGSDLSGVTGSPATISNWLLTPELSFGADAELSFWTRSTHGAEIRPDRLQVRLSQAGASTDVGTTATSVGDFNVLLATVNPALTASGYPFVWTRYTITGLPRAGSGRIAFRYFVTNAGSAGPNGYYIGIDTVSYSAGPPDRAIGGSVTGLQGQGLTLALNGSNFLPITSNGSFQFPGYWLPGTPYTVAIVGQPIAPRQTCVIAANASGVIPHADVNVPIVCVTDHFSVGGTVGGLAGSGLVLRNNGGDNLTIAGNGAFVFATPLPDLSSYAVTVHQQPSGLNQLCAVGNGNGQITGATVINITVSCVTRRYSVGGSVSGLTGSGLVLRNNGGDDLVIAGNGPFTFPTTVPDGSSYEVTVAEQPSGPAQTCTVAGGSGALAGSSVNTVSVSCGIRHWSVAAAVESGSGAISPPEQQVPDGGDATVTVEPDPDWFAVAVTGDTCTPQDNGDGSWTAAGILEPCAIAVRFERSQIDVSAAVAEGEGEIDPEVQTIAYGGDAGFVTTPALAWRTAAVVGDTCTPVDNGDGTWTAAALVGDCQVQAYFSAAQATTLSGGGQIGAIGTPFAMPLLVRVTDADGHPWPDLPIVFEAPAEGASAVLSATHASTDANGVAAVHASANLEPGSYVVHARIDGAPGLTAAAFALSNAAASFGLDVRIDNGRSHARYGQIVDYLVRVGNAGPDPVFGVDVATTLSDGLDEAFAQWQCLSAPSSGCTASGTGALIDGGLHIAAGGTVTWLLSVPVRLTTDQAWVRAEAEAFAADQIIADADDTTLVLLRSGFDVPYVDGTGWTAWSLPEASAVIDAGRLSLGDVRRIELPAATASVDGLSTVWRADLDGEGQVQVQRLVHGEQQLLRLVLERRAGGARLSPWVRHDGTAMAWLTWHPGTTRGVFALEIGNTLLELPD